MESDLLLPCYDSPLSMSIPQSCGKRSDNCSKCSIRWIFLGASAISASVPNVEICLLFLFGTIYFTPVDLKKIHTLKVESYREFWGFQAHEATSEVKEISVFLCMGRCKALCLLKSFLWYAPQLSGACILYFHILRVLRAHHKEWLQSDGC